MIFPNKVQVQRYVAGTKTATGTIPQILTLINPLVKCDLQPHEGIVITPIAGQTIIFYRTMFCNLSDIKENDIITDLDTNEKYKVLNINPYTLLKHMEIVIQGGVT
jgi:uncharacterized protein YkvS